MMSSSLKQNPSPPLSGHLHPLSTATTLFTMTALLRVTSLVFFLASSTKGFTSPQASCQQVALSFKRCNGGGSSDTKLSATSDDTTVVEEEGHPAVLGWPQKYAEATCSVGGSSSDNSNSSKDVGPRILSTEFQIQKATPSQLQQLDTLNWPTWSTSDKPKWQVDNQVQDKEMPYGELSYVINGQLEIIPKETGVPEIVNEGDFVTFPKGFVASWKVLKELTWHYYLY
jgi:uncharacterized cupin superfamily protein